MPPKLRIGPQLIRRTISRPCPRRVCAIQFSQAARRFEETKTAQPERSEEAAESDEKQHNENGKKRKRSIAVPAFAFFGVAAPLGWYLNRRFEQKGNAAVSDPSQFVKYTLVGRDNVSSTCAIFRLRPSTNVTLDLDNPELERAITSVEFKQPQLQIARSYTCLPQQNGQHMDELRFLIRREQKGEVSNFLHRLPVGSEIEVRGLHAEYILPTDVKSVFFLVGGTGIAPAMQLADALDGQADVYILWANRRREDCIGGHNDKTPTKSWRSWWSRAETASAKTGQENAAAEQGALVSMLGNLKRQSVSFDDRSSRLLVDYYVDEEGTRIQKQDVKDVLDTLCRLRGSNATGKNVLLVSGPSGFIAHWAGAKRWADGREVQGPLGGVLSTMDLTGWEVEKL